LFRRDTGTFAMNRLTRRSLLLRLLFAPTVLVLPACDSEDEPIEVDEEGQDDDRWNQERDQPAADAIVCETEITEVECTTTDGEEGVSFCLLHEGEEVWTECEEEPKCWPGDGYDYGCLGQVCTFDGETLEPFHWQEPNCDTPLVLSFDDTPLSYQPAGAASFDISGRGECVSTDWPSAPWLALDRDGDGLISDGRELFGGGTRLAAGDLAGHGFEALAELDSDGDGSITAEDPAFAELVLWSDDDGDRRGELREQTPVAQAGLVAIHLDYASVVECDARGNCGNQRARFEFRDAAGSMRSGEVVDVYLSCQ